ncbi:MAG: DUF2163 domain-containing protein [Cypionkella sp.]|nr:DUF2163 domain-containing protein [Cypionkella sp.]
MSARSDLLAHMASGVTTLARAWRVVRRDGVRFGFTDHDGDIVLGGELFKASTGLAAKALQSTTGLAVDNTEAVGALSDAGILETDLVAGRYDGAEVTIWLLNWADPAQNMVQFRGTFGEVTRAGGAFKVDLRGQTEALNAPQGRVYQSGCDAVLGGAACKFDLGQSGFREDMTVQSFGADGQIVLAGNSVQSSGWFAQGRLSVATGAAAGLSGMIKVDTRLSSSSTGGGRKIVLWQSLGADLAIGDAVQLEAGCDRSAATCKAKFNNFANFQGFPHIPGEDWQISYPNQGQPKDGGSLFK